MTLTVIASAQVKKVSVLGDSYSTFQGHNPEGYAPFYPNDRNDVTEVAQTWWSLYIKAMSGMYPEDTRLKIQAIAEDGYEFVCWNKDDEEPNTNESRKITLSGKRTLYAHFRKSTGLDDVQAEAVTARKFIRDGQLYIVRDGIVYDVRGARVE